MPLVDKKLVTNPRPAHGNRPSPGDNMAINPPPARQNIPVVSGPPAQGNNVVVNARPTPVGGDVEAAGAAKKECWVKNKPIALIFRAVALLFSFITFLLIVTVRHFDQYATAASYTFAVAFVVMLYTAVFVGIHGHEVQSGKVVISAKVAVWLNVVGDQILALLLLSAGTSGAEAASRERPYYYGRIVDQLTGAVATTFLTFLALEPAALISMYNVSVHHSKSL